MKIPGPRHQRATTSLRSFIPGSTLLVLLVGTLAIAPAQPPKPKPPKTSPADTRKPEIAQRPEAWRKALSELPPPKEEGCYTSAFPRVEWKRVPCKPAPPYPMPPARGPARHFVVGGGGSNDYAANPSGIINAVEGTFPSLSAGLTESGPVANAGAAVANAYTLQINTNQFTSTACAGSPNPACKGWEQFVYENNSTNHFVFIQYWLIQYNASCPSGGSWTQFSFTGSSDIYCYRSTSVASLASAQPVSNLGSMSMQAAVNAAGDSVRLVAGMDAALRVGLNAVAAAAGWTDAEFNVFGDAGNSGGGGQAGFGANSTIAVRTTVHNGTKLAPICQMQSFTGETNNLTLVGTPNLPTQASPAIQFTETNIPGTAASCAAAQGIGDTHLSTFGGLLYDFQASGDFVLAETGKDFLVETRQVSGAPTWPNASVNQAVATRMGDTRVAVCTSPSRLVVDGAGADLADGKILSLPSGVDIARNGEVYTVISQLGDSMRAEVNGSYINVSVGLGHWPAEVHGILTNAPGDLNQIRAHDGSALTNPFSFADLYHHYGDSWRVAADDSLLSVCGQRGVQTGNPQRPFYAKDLDRALYDRSRAVCTAAGVKHPALLDACTLDVAVIGNNNAAQVFLHVPDPVAVATVVDSPGHGSGILKWLLWLLLLVILLWIVRLLLKRKTP